MKRSLRKLFLILFVLIPLAISGVMFSYVNIDNSIENIQPLEAEAFSSDPRVNDSYYVDPEDVQFVIYKPTPPTFNADEEMNFTFQVEKKSTASWTEFESSLTSFDLVFQENNSYYGEYEIGRMNFQGVSDSPSAGPKFGDYFTSTQSGNSATYTLIEPVWLESEIGTSWVSGEQYQIRIAWRGTDVANEEQYTAPATFTYASELPAISISSYFGYSQAIIKVSSYISDEARDSFYDSNDVGSIYSSFKASWGDNLGIDVPNVLDYGDKETKDFVLSTSQSSNYIDMYLLLDNLSDGEQIDIYLDYTVNVDNFNIGYRNEISYSTTFDSQQYDSIELLPIDDSKIELQDLVTLDIDEFNRYGDVIVPITFQWTDTTFPPLWNNISTERPKTVFESEIEYKNVIDSIELNSIRNSAGDNLDPSSIYIDDVSFEKNSLYWDTIDPNNITKTTWLYFSDLKLGETYTVDFTINYAKPGMFEVAPTSRTETVSFDVPDSIAPPTIEITDISVPVEMIPNPEDPTGPGTPTEINDPSNWNELSIDFDILRPTGEDEWNGSYSGSIRADAAFDKIEVYAMEELEDEFGNVYWDYENAMVKELTASAPVFATNNLVFDGLDSQHEYGFQVVGTLSDTYARIFGFDVTQELGIVTSDVVSSSTRNRYDEFEITANPDAHDVYEPGDEETEFTYAFYIDSPLSGQWDILNQADLDADPTLETSAFSYKNIIDDVYITDVYSDEDRYSPDAEALYGKRFYVNNTEPGTSNSIGTDIESLNVKNGTNDQTNWNTITVDNLVTSWFYYGKLVVELTPTAYDPDFGWMTTDGTNTITKDIVLQPGRPIKAPTISVASKTTEQTSYNLHKADINFTIDISSMAGVDSSAYETLDLYFQYVLNRPGTSVDISSNIQLTEVETGDPVGAPKDFAWNTFIDTDYFDPLTNTYSYTYEIQNLKGNTSYRLDIINTEDLGYIEDVQDISVVFDTEPNEVLTSNDLGVWLSDYETGSQNEATNTFDKINVNVTQLDPAAIDESYFGNDLANNITSMEVVDNETGATVATFDPAEISSLTNGDGDPATPDDNTTITATIAHPVEPEAIIDISKYSLVVENDSLSMPGFTTPLSTMAIDGKTLYKVGGLENPDILSVDLIPYKDSMVIEWEVEHMNNIASATAIIMVNEFEGYEIDPDSGEEVPVYSNNPRIVASEEFTSFGVADDSNWVDSLTLTEFTAKNQYMGMLYVEPIEETVGGDFTNFMFSNIEVAKESLNMEVHVDRLETSEEAIAFDFSWTGNSSTVFDEVIIEVIDLYGEPGIITGEPPMIYAKAFDINTSSSAGSMSVNINNNNLLDGHQIYSNQEYEIKTTFITQETEEEYAISYLLDSESQGTSFKQLTKEKQSIFLDDISLFDANEDSIQIEYQWTNRDVTSDVHKAVTDHRLRLYSGSIVDSNKLLLETGNLVDVMPGESSDKVIFEVNDGDIDINGNAIDIAPTFNFTVESYVTYDTYPQNSRDEFEQESVSSLTFIVPWNKTEISVDREESKFVDNDSILIDFNMRNATAFKLDPNSYVDLFITDSEGNLIDFIYEGNKIEAGDGLSLTYTDISAMITTEENLSEDTIDFEIQIDGVPTRYQDHLTLFYSVNVNNIDGTITEYADNIQFVNGSDQSKVPYVDAGNMGVLNRVEMLGGEEYYYELQVAGNHAINSYTDVVISEVNTPNSVATGIEVLDEVQVNAAAELEYKEYNLYISVESSLLAPGTEYNDLSFLVGRYIGVNASNLEFTTAKWSRASVPDWNDYDWFEIGGFVWLYPPKTPAQIFLEFLIWVLIAILIAIIVGSIIGFIYYIFRITFSNKKWYPIVETIANEKFAVFTDYVERYGWTQKFQEYADLSEKNIHELREYALKMNIPITFEMNRKELLQTVSLLTDEEIADFETFSDDDIDVRNYEILDFWKVARYKSHHPWIKYKLSKLEEKGILTSDDDRLSSLQEQLDFIEQEKKAQEEREKTFKEIQEMVSEVLDTNTELATEFSVDPLEQFKSELKQKVEHEEELAEKERREAEEAEAARLAEEKAELERIAAEEFKKNAKEIKAIKDRLKIEYDKISVSIAAFNQKANQEVKGADKAREVSDSLNRERIKINKLIETFKMRQDRITELGGRQKSYPFEPLENVDIKIAVTALEKAHQEFEALTKQTLLTKATELKLDVKPAWNKERLIKDMIKQMKDRGDFND